MTLTVRARSCAVLILALHCLALVRCSAHAVPSILNGTWQYQATGPAGASNSSATPLVFPATISVSVTPTTLQLSRNWTDSSGFSILVDAVSTSWTGSGASSSPILSRIWPYNVFLGVEYAVSTAGAHITSMMTDFNTTAASWKLQAPLESQQKGGNVSSGQPGPTLEQSTMALDLVSPPAPLDGVASTPTYLRYTVSTSQPCCNTYTFWYTRVDEPRRSSVKRSRNSTNSNNSTSTNTSPSTSTSSSSGSSGKVPKLTVASQAPYNFALADAWTLTDPLFQVNAMMVSLQGLANRDGADLYLTYPADWAYSYTPEVREYFASSRSLTFTNVSFSEYADLFAAFKDKVKGFVVWDPTVRESLVVAYTAAGVEDAIVVGPSLVGVVQAFFPLIANFSHVFRGQTPSQIYSKAADMYWDKCTSTTIVWAGGVCGTQMQPGVMDWGVAQRAFFTDLSTKPGDPGYALADTFMGKMAADSANNPTPFMVMGWHSYCKDYEHTFTTLTSKHGGRVHGLNTNPNLSFSHQIKLPPGYRFHNRHSPPIPPNATAPHKVNVVLVQTDGLGLGAWTKPGRGTLPYAWEVTLPDLEIQPALLQMFYEQATSKDYFVAALSGPGYMYPKAVPPALLPSRLELAQQEMVTLDLQHMIIFDASDCKGAHTVSGDTWLTPSVVSQYFRTMNRSVGFLNGYGPTFTFQHDAATQHSVLSFDYYLDPGRSVADAVADINLLAELNAVRPYFLAVHVREFSTVGKVEQIIAGLDADTFQVVPVDTFFAYANAGPTWWNHYS